MASSPDLVKLVGGLGDKLLDRTLKELRERAPVKTGRLRASFRKENKMLVSTAPYAVAVDRHRPYIDEALDSAIRDTRVS